MRLFLVFYKKSTIHRTAEHYSPQTGLSFLLLCNTIIDLLSYFIIFCSHPSPLFSCFIHPFDGIVHTVTHHSSCYSSLFWLIIIYIQASISSGDDWDFPLEFCVRQKLGSFFTYLINIFVPV